MNPLTNTKNITKLNEREISLGVNPNASWHSQYKDSAWIFIGGLPYDLTEGDVLCIFSQFGEVVNINLVRDKKTGKQKGFCFLCYEDQRSTILAVDNLNGVKILGRTIRVDHVAAYKPPKEREDHDEITKSLYKEGCAPRFEDKKTDDSAILHVNMGKGSKKVKKSKKKKNKDRKCSDSDDSREVRVKIEKRDPGYDRYENTQLITSRKRCENSRTLSVSPDRSRDHRISPVVDRRRDVQTEMRSSLARRDNRTEDMNHNRHRNRHSERKHEATNVHTVRVARNRRRHSSESSVSDNRTERKKHVLSESSSDESRHHRSWSTSRR